MQNIAVDLDHKQSESQDQPATSLSMPSAELQLQRHVSHTPKNSPKKSLEQFSARNSSIFNIDIGKDNCDKVVKDE